MCLDRDLDARLAKLRQLVLHDGTPTNERQSALRKLESLLAPMQGDARQIGITRSSRIGKHRHKTAMDEFGRLEPYASGRNYGEVIGDMIQCCQAIGITPVTIDFGFFEAKEPVVAIGFVNGSTPDPLALQTMVRRDWPAARVTMAQDERDGCDKTLLIFLGERVPIT